MSGTADPWEPACMPTFRWKDQVTPTVERSPGPERVEQGPVDPSFTPPPFLGFKAAEDPT